MNKSYAATRYNNFRQHETRLARAIDIRSERGQNREEEVAPPVVMKDGTRRWSF